MKQIAMFPDRIRHEVGAELIADLVDRANACAEVAHLDAANPLAVSNGTRYGAFMAYRSAIQLVAEATGAEYEDENGRVLV